jgi:protein-export membrane protein SecD
MEPDMVAMLGVTAVKKDAGFETALKVTQKIAQNESKDFLEVMPIVFRRDNLKLVDYFSNYGGTDDEIVKAIARERSKAIDGALEVVRSRVDQFGVSEPIIQKAERSDRIIVELPGIDNPERARMLIQETAILQFQLVRREKEVSDFVLKMDNLLRNSPELLVKAQTAEVIPESLITDMETATDSTVAADSLKAKPADTTKAVAKKDAKGDSLAKKEVKPVAKKEAKADSLAKKEVKKAEGKAVAKVDTTKKEISASKLFGGDTTKTTEADTGEAENQGEKPFTGMVDVQGSEIRVPLSERVLIERLMSLPEVKAEIPLNSEVKWAAKDDTLGGETYRSLFLLNSNIELTGDHLKTADYTFGSTSDPRNAGKPVVQMSFDGPGSRKFAEVTGANIGRRLAIVLNDRVYTAPNIKSKISGDAVIEGMSDLDEAKLITIVLKAGALPVPLMIQNEQTVGPSMGQDSIKKGVMSTLIGGLLVIIFMIFYYKMSGVIADFAVIINVIALLAGMAALHSTLTLPGIAGIILTMGMAVDANVLIYERIREELRAGKTVRAAIDAGYARAFVTIVDAQVTTLITSAVLYQFGSGPVKGFAITLFIGILLSMFTSIVITRLIFEFITSRRHYETLSI